MGQTFGYDFQQMSPTPTRWQRIRNECRPADPKALRDRVHPIPVRVRVVWDDDGEEWIDAMARRWDQRHVFVTVHDPRAHIKAFWLAAEDVVRRPGQS